MPKFVLNKTGRTQLIGVAGKRRGGPLLGELDEMDDWLERMEILINGGGTIAGTRPKAGSYFDTAAYILEAKASRILNAERLKCIHCVKLYANGGIYCYRHSN